MKRILAATTALSLMAAPVAFAANDSASDLKGNSPAITEGGNANVVGSINNTTEVAPARPGIGISEYDPTRMTMTEEQYNAIAATVGAEFKTQDEEILGYVTNVTFDAQGNPELVVDLVDDTKIDAETLVVTLLPESVIIQDGRLIIDTTADELYLKAQSGSKRDDETRTTVIVM